MRKITKKAIASFNSEFTFTLNESNTTVKVSYGRHPMIPNYKGRLTVLSLHGNDIAIKTESQTFITNAGWPTKTTKERLNGIPGVSIYQKNFEWFLNDNPWDGKLIEIKS